MHFRSLVLVMLSIIALNQVEAGGDEEHSSGSQSRPEYNTRKPDGNSGFWESDSFASTAAEGDMGPEDEYYLGRAVAVNILQKYRPYLKNPGLTEYLNKICRALTLNAETPLLFNGYHVIILDSPEFNAFATSGGHIFVTRGLIDAADSEDALAAVIAHEIAHIQLRHGLQLISDTQLLRDLSENANQARQRASKNNSRKQAFYDSVSQMMDNMIINGYSQPQEFEADNLALSLLAKVGYTPSSLIDMLSILEVRQRNIPGGFNKTHPSPRDRIANAKLTVGNYRISDTRAFRISRFQAFK
jgi:predicted Zn-dependent protease